MHTVDDIIQEASSLPIESRAVIIDSLLRTLNQPDPEIEAQWTAVAKQRLADLRSGKVKAVPGTDVFSKIRNRFGA